MNKVRISYTVPLTEVPSEAQSLVNKLRKENSEISNLLKDLNFSDDFSLSHEKLKSISLVLDKAQTIALDTLSLSEGYIELQNNISTKVNQDDNEVAQVQESVGVPSDD